MLYDAAADERCSPLRVRDFLYNAAVGAAIGRPSVKIRSDAEQSAACHLIRLAAAGWRATFPSRGRQRAKPFSCRSIFLHTVFQLGASRS